MPEPPCWARTCGGSFYCFPSTPFLKPGRGDVPRWSDYLLSGMRASQARMLRTVGHGRLMISGRESVLVTTMPSARPGILAEGGALPNRMALPCGPPFRLAT